jgi:hypothetical protein
MKKYCLVDDSGCYRNDTGGWYTLKNIMGYKQGLFIAYYKECVTLLNTSHRSYSKKTRTDYFNGRCGIHIVPVETALIEMAEIKLRG